MRGYEYLSSPLIENKLIVSQLFVIEFPFLYLVGISAESNTNLQLPYTERLLRRRPFAPPSSNWADIWLKRGSTVKAAGSYRQQLKNCGRS
jgi:hypothetical protein